MIRSRLRRCGGVRNVVGERAYLVYDANGGVLGEAMYFVRKWLRIGKCELCAVTHRGLRPREAWVRATGEVDVEIDARHRNELDARLRDFIDGAYPCVVGEQDGDLSWILRPNEIEPFVGEPERLAKAIAAHFEGPPTSAATP